MVGYNMNDQIVWFFLNEVNKFLYNFITSATRKISYLYIMSFVQTMFSFDGVVKMFSILLYVTSYDLARQILVLRALEAHSSSLLERSTCSFLNFLSRDLDVSFSVVESL